jgi:archaemetzincin
LCAAFWLFSLPARAQGPYTVCLQPLGEHDASLLAPMAEGIRQAYGFEVRRLAPRDLPSSAWYAPRTRYRAQLLLDYLRAQVLPGARGCDAVMAFTAVDISITKGEHSDWGVLGLSYLQRQVGVVSSFRMHGGIGRALQASRPRLVSRAVKVMLHEIGHVVGLPHRAEGPSCLMNDAGGVIATADEAIGALCPSERAAAEGLLGRSLPQRQHLDWKAILAAEK